MRKIIKHHIKGGTRESHPCVQDLQHPILVVDSLAPPSMWCLDSNNPILGLAFVLMLRPFSHELVLFLDFEF